MITTFINSIMGGLIISIASYIYLQTNGIIGAFLFSIGLLIILNMRFKLYTGAIGYARINTFKELILILFGNIIGTHFLLLFPNISIENFIETKLNLPLYLVFFKAFVCGIFMYVAVDCFNKNKPYMVILCVTGFILFGAEHCIADLCYFITSGNYQTGMISFFITTLLGNSFGSILIDITQNL